MSKIEAGNIRIRIHTANTGSDFIYNLNGQTQIRNGTLFVSRNNSDIFPTPGICAGFFFFFCWLKSKSGHNMNELSQDFCFIACYRSRLTIHPYQSVEHSVHQNIMSKMKLKIKARTPSNWNIYINVSKWESN